MRGRHGFTLLEVMIALFILATSVFLMSELQVKAMLRVLQSREDIDRLYLIKKYAYRMSLDPANVRRQSHVFHDPDMRLVVQPRPIHKKSALAPFIKELQLLDATATWARGTARRTLSLITLVPLIQKESA